MTVGGIVTQRRASVFYWSVMFRRVVCAAAGLALLLACGKGEHSSVAELVKDIATEARTKTKVQVRIHLAADEPTAEDRAMLQSIESAVEKDNIGRLVNSGWEPGYAFVTVEVDKTAEATEKLRAIVLKAGLVKRTSFKVIAAE